ncbi:MAG: DUF2586 family protein [Flavipsychrobacter sp.]
MNELNGVTVTKQEGGLNRLQKNTDNVRGLVVSGVAATGLALDVSTPLNSIDAAKALGITKQYDTDNAVLVYHHILRFFQKNPFGKLWLRLVAQTVSLEDMVDKDFVGLCAVEKLMIDSGGEIKRFGIVRNPASGYTPTITDGLDSDVLAAVPKAEALTAKLFGDHYPTGVIIEGRSFSGNAASAKDLRTMQSPGASVCIGADLDVAEDAANPQAAYADIGTLLGVSSAARVHENVGWVEKFNIQSAADGAFVRPGYSGGLALSAISAADQKTLNDKGYIFLRTFVGYPGVYFNDSHTCTDISSDYAYTEDVDVLHKAVRSVYAALVPKTNSPVKVDSDGKLHPSFIANFTAIAENALNQMLVSEEISGVEVWIDPDQDINATGILLVRIRVLKNGTARWIGVNIGFTAKIAA